MTLTVTIRTKEQEKKMNQLLQNALSILMRNPHKEIPLVYQYLHNPNAELIIDADNRVGTITNVRRNRAGDIIGDVAINNILKIASNFVGEIDNMAASNHPDTRRVEIDAFIIYDKTAKDEIRVRKQNVLNGRMDAFAKSGEIPIMSRNGVDTMREISEKLVKEYENMTAEQHSKPEKEDN